MRNYLAATAHIDADHPRIITKVAELTAHCYTNADKARVIYEFVRDSATPDPVESYVASDIMTDGGNLCYQRAILLVALCRATRIPARLHLQRVSIQDWGTPARDIAFAHGLAGIFLGGQWHLYEPTGNPHKWWQWSENAAEAEKMMVPFAPNRDCLFDMSRNPRISGELFPIFFADWSNELIVIIERMNAF